VTASVAVIGAGRMGQGIALALSRSGTPVRLLGRTPKPVPAPLTVEVGEWEAACAASDIVLVATPDAVIPSIAERLGSGGAISSRQAVLHLSGLLGWEALASLRPTGAALGSFHPLQTIADPGTAAERFRGAFAGVEGDPRAVEAGRGLAEALGMTAVEIPAAAKAIYHAGATLVANYSVALVGMAVRLAIQAGVPAEMAPRLYLPLLHGAVNNLDRLPPAGALTGAIRRGDLDTVRAHLASLEADDRLVYAAVGLEALLLAREAGLGAETAAAIERLLRAELTG